MWKISSNKKAAFPFVLGFFLIIYLLLGRVKRDFVKPMALLLAEEQEMSSLPTRETLLQAAQSLLRSKGYAAFSYADLERVVGIRKASIHHHFATKEDLGLAVVEAYMAQVQASLQEISQISGSTAQRLQAFVVLFSQGQEEGFLPLCGALAAELASLPASLQLLAQHFLELQRRWLKQVLDEGVQAGEVLADLDTEATAHHLLCQMEGAGFVNWTLDKSRQVDVAVLLRIAGIHP